MSQLHINDIGTDVILSVTNANGSAFDLTGYTAVLYFIKPDTTIVSKNAVVVSPATLGQLKYTTESGFLAQTGLWQVKARITGTPRTFWTEDAQFYVYGAPA